MRGRLLPTLLAVLTMLVLGAGTAPATTGWRITPGGPFTGTGGPIDGPFTCAGSTIAGQFSMFGSIGVIDEINYDNCSGGPLTIEVTVDLPWTLDGTGYWNGVTSIDINDIAGSISSPGCYFEVAGSAAASFDNATSVLTMLDDNSVITFVDPANDCFGLISQGQQVALLSDSYAIHPPQVIEPRVAV